MGTPNGIRSRQQRLPEENIMAILDVIGVKEQDDIRDDKLSFLAAIRAVCITPEMAQVPTRKMYEAVFQILKENKSLELTIMSYQLLLDLEKRFPPVTVAKMAGSSSDVMEAQLVINSEVWSPFIANSANDSAKMDGFFDGNYDPIDCSKVVSLIRDIAAEVCHDDSKLPGVGPDSDGRSKRLSHDIMGKMMMFQYLVTLLETDFICRCQVFKRNIEWALIRDSFLNQLLGSQRTNLKNLVKSSLDIMASKSKESFDSNDSKEHSAVGIFKKTLRDLDSAYLAEAEIRYTLCLSVQKLLTMMTEIDTIKKEADKRGQTSRSDGSRTPVLEIVINELCYNKSLIGPFLQALTEPKWKMDIILTYIMKYFSRSITKNVGSDIEATTIKDIFNFLSDASATNARSMTKRISAVLLKLLLVHGFQAYFSLREGTNFMNSSEEDVLLKETCELFLSAFQNLQSADNKNLELIAVERDALFTAATILS